MNPPKALLVTALAVTAAVVTLGSSKADKPDTAGKSAVTVNEKQAARGQYLVKFGGCNDCHTPLKMTEKGPVPDFSRAMSGHPQDVQLPAPELKPGPWFAATAGMTAWAGPWGISYAANLTPDNNTGIGIWTEEMFVQSMRTGRHMGHGREILPPMPWQSVATLSDEDLKSIFAYLKSLPPISNRVPLPVGPDGKTVNE